MSESGSEDAEAEYERLKQQYDNLYKKKKAEPDLIENIVSESPTTNVNGFAGSPRSPRETLFVASYPIQRPEPPRTEPQTDLTTAAFSLIDDNNAEEEEGMQSSLLACLIP
jgi:hypothetical protein